MSEDFKPDSSNPIAGRHRDSLPGLLTSGSDFRVLVLFV